MKDAVLKSWKTTGVGLIIIGYELYKVFVLKAAPDFGQAISLLFALGFFLSKDATASHTK